MSLDYADYSALRGVRASRLKLMAESPLHYREFEDVDTASRGKLRSIHAIVLEPENAQIAVFDGRRDERTAVYRDFLANHAGCTILNPAEYESVQRVRDGIYRHPIARGLLTAPGESEVTIEWDDHATGLACKARLDRLQDGAPVIIDLKTYGTSDPRIIAQRVAKMGAHIQAAHYCDGLATVDQILPSEIRYYLICVEERAPYDVCVVELEYDQALAAGRAERDRLMARLAECTRTNVWPGRCPDIVPLDLPAWVGAEDDDIIGERE